MAQSEAAIDSRAPMTKQQTRRMHMLIWACWAVYGASMMSKKVYAVELVEVTKAWGTSNTQAGVPLTCYYITYCIAQILFAVFIKKLNMKKFVLATVSVSSVLLMGVALTQSLTQLSVIMSLIGITHCGI